MTDDLRHFGTLGMKWGVRKPRGHEKTDNADFRRQVKKGVALADSSLADSGSLPAGSKLQTIKQAKAAADFAQSLGDAPFAIQDEFGQWQQYG